MQISGFGKFTPCDMWNSIFAVPMDSESTAKVVDSVDLAESGRNAALAPAYDLVATVVYPERLCADELALSLNDSRRFEDVSVRAFEVLAALIETPFGRVAQWASEMAERVRAAWRDPEVQERFSAEERAKITRHMARVPLP